jgi:hypothetical protein
MSDYSEMGRSRLIAEIERLQSFKTAYMEWSDKTEWVQDSVEAGELGKHRADAIRIRLDKLKAENHSLRKFISNLAESDAEIAYAYAAISSPENP